MHCAQVYHHEDFVTDALLAGGDVLDACAEHVNCRFCGKQFLRRHQKLLMLHIEQKHVDDLRRLLDIRLPATAADELTFDCGIREEENMHIGCREFRGHPRGHFQAKTVLTSGMQ